MDPPYSTSSEAVTSTVESRPVITTIAVPWSISTATADAGSVKKGDLIVEFSESFRNRLLDVAKSACGAPGKRDLSLEERDLKARAAVCQNMGQFMSGTIGDGAPGGLDIISFNKPIITAHDMEAGIRKFFAVGRTLYRSRLFVGGAVIIWLGLYLEGKNDDGAQPLVVPSNQMGEPTGKVASDLPTSTSTGSSCKTTKTGKTAVSSINFERLHLLNRLQPICEDTKGCNGMAHKTCEVEVRLYWSALEVLH